MINTKDKPKCLSVDDFKKTLDFISEQDVGLWKSMKCPFEECNFTQGNPHPSNLRKHVKKCKFSPGYKSFQKADDPLTFELTSLEPLEITENPYIIRGDWGYRNTPKSDPENLSGLFTFLKKCFKEWNSGEKGPMKGNFAIHCLKMIILNKSGRTSISQSVRPKDGKILFYYDNKWISKITYESEWFKQQKLLKRLWFEKIEEICESRYMMFTDFTGLNLKLLEDIGKPETKANIEQKIEIFVEEAFPIVKQTLYDGPQQTDLLVS